MRLGEVGITNRENSRLYTKKPQCNTRNGGNFVNVGLVDIRAAITIFISGIIGSICICGFEILTHKYLLKTRTFLSKKSFKK